MSSASNWTIWASIIAPCFRISKDWAFTCRGSGRVFASARGSTESVGEAMAVIKFSYNVPLDQTMAFEAVYHENLRLKLTEKQEIRDIPGSIFVWMFVNGALAGESYGNPLAAADEQ